MHNQVRGEVVGAVVAASHFWLTRPMLSIACSIVNGASDSAPALCGVTADHESPAVSLPPSTGGSDACK
eukprot:CAMPEP_0115865746 /NCGR_PEP_ID=MMETSP0287-20121206/19883_1 /TAXON_ID=412157 /ORGANISM="Chrysochromulina rotalis, Strain UIO044" /LENGTH=68 /DNA_ID=CAMNT_0003320273 /DNA_START=155 /DNA_END=358 /DNA_ORIENTATION=-